MKRFLCFAFLLVCLCACLANGSMPTKVYAVENLPISSKSAILIDYASGEILASKNPEEKFEVASMVKLMTIYLTIDAVQKKQISLDDDLVASEYASSMGGSQVFLDAGSKYNVGKMLESVIMASANDASVALGEYISGSEKEFVALMNKTAKQLGMTSTQYANATGLPAPMQFSTALDTSKLLSQLVDNEIYHSYSAKWMDELVHPSGRKTEIVNTNKLTRYFKGCDCGKTGFTDEAGYCLASSAVRDDMRLIAVVIGAKSAKERFSESVKLLNFGFNNFKTEVIVDSALEIGEVEVLRSKTALVKVYAKESFSAVTQKALENNYDVEIKLNNAVVAPVVSGAVVGQIIVSKQGVVLKEIDLVVKQNVEALSFWEGIEKVAHAW